jgi:N-acyl amino acid synthase of PEP-CTERM/exosortase system
MEHLAEHFHRYFRAEHAQSAEQCARVHALRYQVYCEELKFEDAARFPDGEERDEHDARALHGVILHKPSGRAAGCFRLLPRWPGIPLPFERVCGERLDDSEWHPARLPEGTAYAEISRLAVHGDFRRRQGEQGSPLGVTSIAAPEESPRHYPLIASGLFLASSALALEVGIEHVYVMMEPRLARLLKICGLMFRPVGQLIDYHGQRGPYLITKNLLYQHLPGDARELLEDFSGTFRAARPTLTPPGAKPDASA